MRILSSLAALLITTTAAAAPTTPAVGPRSNPTTAADWMRHPDEGSYYTETWSGIIRSNAGHVVYLNFLYSNIGVVSGRSGVNVSFSLPGKLAKSWQFEYDQDAYSQNRAAGRVQVSRSSFTLKGGKAQLLVREKGVEMDVTFEARVPGVKYHSGRIWLDDDKESYVDTYFHMPAADVAGHITTKGRKHDLGGVGYIDHWAQNVLAGDYSTHWYTGRYFGPEYNVVFLMWRYDKDHGGKLRGRAMVTDKEKVLVFTDRLATLRPERSRKDPNGHRYTTHFEATIEQGDVKVRSHFEGDHLHDRAAVMEQMGWAQRQVAKLVAGNPIFYRLQGKAVVNVQRGAAPMAHFEGPALIESIVMDDED